MLEAPPRTLLSRFSGVAVPIASASLLLLSLLTVLSFFFGTPNVAAILRALAGLAQDGSLWHDVVVSSVRWLLGWVIGAVLGLAVGIWTGRSRQARSGLEGFLTLLRAIPAICLVPLSIRFFGLDETGKYFVVAWAVFFICWLGAHRASLTLPEQIVWRGLSLKMTWRDWFWAGLFPHIRPAVAVALRTSLLLGLIVTAVAELAGVYERSSGNFWSEGLGYRVFRTLDQARDDQLFAAISVFSLLGMSGELLFGAAWSTIGRAALAGRIKATRDDLARLQTIAVAEQPDRQSPYPPVIKLRGLTVRYEGFSEAVLRDLDLEVASGTTVAVLGRSGSGKTTLIRSLSGYSARAMRISGEVEPRNAKGAGPRIGMVPQDAPVFDDFTCWQNVKFGDRLRGSSREEQAAAAAAMRRFGLGENLDQLAGTLSGGQRQRLAFATALLNAPHILCCDEPFSALDAFTRRALQEFYVENVRNRRTVTTIWITHDVDEALIVADSVVVLRNGKLFPIPLPQLHERADLATWLRSAEFAQTRQAILDAVDH